MKILSMKNISKSFGSHKVLDNISLEINEPEILALVGPNGSGKSTLLNIMANIVKADSGTVEILEKSNQDISIYEDYSYMIDNSVLYDYLTGLDHLKYISESHKLDKAAIREAVELVGIKNFIDKKVGNYSLGMKQQLLFTMSILNEPKFLVLDEPFNGLDPISIIKIRNILMDFNRRGSTILLSSHNLSQVDQMTSHIVFVKEGGLIEEDISLYGEDIYYIAVKNPEYTYNSLKDFKIKSLNDEIIVSTMDYKLASILAKIGELDEITGIRKEKLGAEKRYEELYGPKS